MKIPNVPFIQSYYPKYRKNVTGEVMLLTHSLEAPNTPGIARSLANGWWRNPNNQTSVHIATDSVEAVQTFEFPYQVWGCGTGNAYVFQFEHVGYAHWTKKQWSEGTMKDVISRSAKVQAYVWWQEGIKSRGYKHYPEWLKLSEIKAGKSGLLTHNDARLVWGGTTHTDPGPNFPYKALRDEIHKELDRLTGKKFEPEPDTYTVKKGDTLSGIAQKFNIPLVTLVANNGIKNPDLIYVNQEIKLTGGSKKPAPPKKEKYTAPPSKSFPFPKNEYIGLITGPSKSHGGFYASEKKYIRWVQTRMNELGRKISIDGVFGRATQLAVSEWQKAYYRKHGKKLQYPGQVWWDDWQYLQKDR